MATQAADPWLAIGDPVTADPATAAPAKAPQAANDPYAGIAEPVSDTHPAALDTSGTQYQAGFADEVGAQPKSKLAPEDEAHLVSLLRAGHDDLAAQFAASKGFDISNAAAVKQARDQTGAVNPDTAYTLPDLKDLPRDLTQGAGMAAARGVADVVPGVGNLTALARTVDAKLGLGGASSNRSLGDEFAYQQDLGAGAEQGDETAHPWARLAGQLFGGLAIPSGLEGVGLQAGSDVLRAGGSMADARAAAFVAVRNRAAKVGGVYGAAHGSLGADNLTDAVTGGVTEGALGAGTGAALLQAGKLLPERAALVAATDGQKVMAAADRVGLGDAMLPADVGGATTRRFTAGVAQTPLGVAPIAKQARMLNERGAQVLQSQAATLGDAAHDVEGLGTAAIEGAQKYVASAKRVGGRMYDAAVNKAGNVKVDLQSARDTLDQQIERLKAVPGGGQGLEEAQVLRSQLDEPFTVQGIRDWRTENFIDPKFRNTPVEGRMKAVVNAASRDVDSALRSGGHEEAANLYAAADNHWREMLANIKRNIEPVIGPLHNLKSAEGVATALNSASKNNGVRLATFVRSLPDEQQGIVSSSLLTPLGRDKAGAFSLSRFESDWNKISPIAKREAFTPDLRSALDDLATVGKGTKAAMAYANHSNTGSALEIGRILTAITALPTLGASLGGQYAMGRLLSSPRFARWLARAPRTALSGPAYAERLTRIARAEPQIANEVLQLQQRLADAFTSSPTRLAAQKPADEAGNAQGDASQQQPESQGFQP